jgi:hypothetical protein
VCDEMAIAEQAARSLLQHALKTVLVIIIRFVNRWRNDVGRLFHSFHALFIRRKKKQQQTQKKTTNNKNSPSNKL